MTESTGRPRAAASFDRLQEIVSNKLMRVVCPLYKESIHRPDPVGSGVLVRVSDLILIATAAHVLEDLGHGPRYVGAIGEVLPLPALQFTSDLRPGETRDNDRLDLGCAVLDPETASRVPSADTLFLPRLDTVPLESISQTAQYLFSGYPWTKQPRKLFGHEFAANSYSALITEATAESYEAIGLNRAQNILLKYDKKDIFRRLEKTTGPDLPGVSGGAIWRIDGPGATSDEPLLSGIVIAWRNQDAPLGIVGTRIAEWIRLAARTFPEAFASAAKLREQSGT